jgi:hypothetical protein
MNAFSGVSTDVDRANRSRLNLHFETEIDDE